MMLVKDKWYLTNKICVLLRSEIEALDDDDNGPDDDELGDDKDDEKDADDDTNDDEPDDEPVDNTWRLFPWLPT